MFRIWMMALVLMGSASVALAQPTFKCSGGSGTKSDPWLISSIQDMNELARQINMEIGSEEQQRENPQLWGNLAYYNGYSDCYFELTCDLDYSNEPVVNGSNYTPVGVVNPFGGIFDGKGHTISGIIINRTEKNNGIFGNISYAMYAPEFGPGLIKNLTLANSQITGGNYTGGIVGDCRSAVENCHVLANCAITAAADGTECVGGVVGRAWYNDAGYYNLGGGVPGGWWDVCQAEVIGCTNEAPVSTGGKSGCSQLGGIAGGIAKGGNIGNCLNLGEVDTRVVNTSAGGVVGNAISGDWMGISGCYYSAPCTVGGLYGEDTEGARMAVASDEEPRGIGDEKKQYDSFDGAPGLTVFENGMLYKGKYYFYDKKLGELFPLYEGDEGTETKPFQIKTEDDLRKLARAVDFDTDFGDMYFVLTNDLDFGGGTEGNFKPIGGVYVFAGHFDGQGHTISGIVVDRPNNFNGLFGKAKFVKNVALSNSTIVGNCIGEPSYNNPVLLSQTGGIVGYTDGGTIENCHVTSSVTIRVARDKSCNFGGIAGYCKSKVLGCTSAATITSEFADSRNIGGIVGIAEKATLTHCINFGPVTSDSEYSGSVAGYNCLDQWGNPTSEFEMCYYSGQSTKGGVEGAEIKEVWKAEGQSNKPSVFMSKVSEYRSFDNMPGIAVYKNCIYYDGLYYYHSDNTPIYGHFPRYEGDEGTAEKPFQIKTKEDLQALSYDVNKNKITFEGVTFAQKNDIHLNGYIDNGVDERYWYDTNLTPIGQNSNYEFVATYDGEGHKITGVSMKKDDYINNNTYRGIFGRVGNTGVVKNLSVGDSYMYTTGFSGPIAGYALGRIENCHTLADFIIAGDPTYTGGIVGQVQLNGVVTGCTNQATLPSSTTTGGIVGYLYGSEDYGTPTISDCLNLGKLLEPTREGAKMQETGGIVGVIDWRAEGYVTVKNCYYAGACTVGGINMEDTDGARKAVGSTTKPEDIGDEVTVYPSYEGAPGLTAYTAGLFYNGKYYTASVEEPTYTATDVVRLINMIAGKTPVSEDLDLNGDGKVDTDDLTIMVSLILK